VAAALVLATGVAANAAGSAAADSSGRAAHPARIAHHPVRRLLQLGPVLQYDGCRTVLPPRLAKLAAVCRATQKAGSDVGALCRRLLQTDRLCRTPLAPAVVRAQIAAYQRSWTHRALGLQRSLADDAPLSTAQWLGTHNSFNSIPDARRRPVPALSELDSNQQLSMAEQLRVDMRSLEVDAHWARDPHTGRFDVRLCHAKPGGFGCTLEHTLADGLRPVAAWVRAHPGQVLLLYVDDDLRVKSGYDAATAAIENAFTDADGRSLVYRPSPTSTRCEPLRLSLTRDKVLAAGKRVLVWSSCKAGGALTPSSAWNSLVFDDSTKFEQRPDHYAAWPVCDGPKAQRAYGSQFVRYFEDSTLLTALTDSPSLGINKPTARHMAGCGVNLVSFDQLLPGDDRLAASVWSWAPGEPRASAGRCAVMTAADGRFHAARCVGRTRPVACRSGEGTWSVVGPAVRLAAAAQRCRAAGAGTWSVPRSGREASQLHDALTAAGESSAWLAYRHRPGGWTALDRR
jgi:hypothetical protein